MRNRRQVVEFSDCLLARNAGVRLQEHNGRASSEFVFKFWGPTAGSNRASAVDDALFRQSRTGVRVGDPSRHAGAREHVNWSRQPTVLAGMFVVSRRGTGPRSLGMDGCWGWEQGVADLAWDSSRDQEKPQPVKLAPATFLADGRVLSLATLLSGPIESGMLFRDHWKRHEKKQNRNCDKPLLFQQVMIPFSSCVAFG